MMQTFKNKFSFNLEHFEKLIKVILCQFYYNFSIIKIIYNLCPVFSLP